MTENLQEALLLLAVGMVTVFFILSMVVFSGKALILFVNRFVPTPQLQEVKPAPVLTENDATPSTIEPQKLAAIVAAVENVTKGKGKVTSVEKL